MDVGFLTEDTINYIVLILVYSGLGSWLISRLTSGRADDLRADRARVQETLLLLEQVTKARDELQSANAPRQRIEEFEVMRERLATEASAAVAELNLDAAKAFRTPSSRFLVIPTPRSFLGAFVTLIFATALYFAFMLWLTLGFYLTTKENFDVFRDAASQQTTLFLFGGGLLLIALALLARMIAYRSYDSVIEGRRAEAAAGAT